MRNWLLMALCVVVGVTSASAEATTAQAVGPPMRIALVVDTSAATSEVMQQIRQGLLAFVDAIPAEHELLLVSTGRRAEIRVPPTTDRKKVQGSIRGLLAGDGPTALMDAVIETDDRMMRKATDHSLVFVIVTGDGSENSKNTDGDTFNRWLATLATRRMVAHAIVLKKGNGLPEVVARAMAGNTGGHFETVGTGPLLADRLQSLGAQIASDHEREHK